MKNHDFENFKANLRPASDKKMPRPYGSGEALERRRKSSV
jgi:hypothetical protein